MTAVDIQAILAHPALWAILGPALASMVASASAVGLLWLKSKRLKLEAEIQAATATAAQGNATAASEAARIAKGATAAAVVGVETLTQEFSTDLAKMLAEGLPPDQIAALMREKAKATIKSVATAQGAQDALHAVVRELGLAKRETQGEIKSPPEEIKS